MNTALETSIAVRDIDLIAEMHAVEELQKEVWGVSDLEVVPLTQLVAAKASGGVLIGAFDGETLAGFVYGFAGFEPGTTVPHHHSHMLAVKREYRKHDLGFRLKNAQRERVLAQGITLMSWTFDPLQSLNAYFNFSKLGVISDRYLIDFYGENTSSFLHRSGTDRLWVTWHLTGLADERFDKAGDGPDLPVLVKVDDSDRPQMNDLDAGLSGDQAYIEIPADISGLERQANGIAVEWRIATRRAFTSAIAAGFYVKDFKRGHRGARPCGIYILDRRKHPQEPKGCNESGEIK